LLWGLLFENACIRLAKYRIEFDWTPLIKHAPQSCQGIPLLSIHTLRTVQRRFEYAVDPGLNRLCKDSLFEKNFSYFFAKS
jgi:hypothetical protein